MSEINTLLLSKRFLLPRTNKDPFSQPHLEVNPDLPHNHDASSDKQNNEWFLKIQSPTARKKL